MFFNQNIETWNKLTGILQKYFEENLDSNTPVVNYQSATNLKGILDLNLQDKGAGTEILLKEIKNYLDYSVRTTHPQFNNQLQAGCSFESLLGEVVSFITNTTMATYEVAPVASIMESKLVNELTSKIGYSEGGGIMLTGGSNANLLAMHCARNAHVAEIKHRGNQGLDLCVFVSEEAHYSFKKAVMLMGIGLDNLILIKSDVNGRMSSSHLEEQILYTKTLGKTPIMIASTCGTTVKGAFDPIKENQEIARKHGLWHHIDGAWGGAALFSKNLASKFEGADEADSFTFDAHKVLGTGIITSFLLTKRKSAITAANSGGGSEYLFHHYENADYDTGKSSLQCGRKVDALKLWLAWKSMGHDGMSDYVDSQFQKMIYFKKIITDHSRLQLICEPEYLNICFQVIPQNNSLEINQYNLDLRFKMAKAGKFLVNFSSESDGTVYFRIVFANAMTQNKDLDFFIQELLELAE